MPSRRWSSVAARAAGSSRRRRGGRRAADAPAGRARAVGRAPVSRAPDGAPLHGLRVTFNPTTHWAAPPLRDAPAVAQHRRSPLERTLLHPAVVAAAAQPGRPSARATSCSSASSRGMMLRLTRAAPRLAGTGLAASTRASRRAWRTSCAHAHPPDAKAATDRALAAAAAMAPAGGAAAAPRPPPPQPARRSAMETGCACTTERLTAAAGGRKVAARRRRLSPPPPANDATDVPPPPLPSRLPPAPGGTTFRVEAAATSAACRCGGRDSCCGTPPRPRSDAARGARRPAVRSSWRVARRMWGGWSAWPHRA